MHHNEYPETKSTHYIENPKTKGSGIICCIPQTGLCPVGCPDCFFQEGKSYLEPLGKHLPNIPSLKEASGMVLRVNDGNDSNHQRVLVIDIVKNFPWKFYNTSIPKSLKDFNAPVVLTVNPNKKTDESAYLIDPPLNLMFVRVRTNTWNLDIIDQAIDHYTALGIPVVLTFMAYYAKTIPEKYKHNYEFRQRTMNSYWVITQEAWDEIMDRYANNSYVYTCGKSANDFACHRCGNCLREYFATMEKLKA